MLSIVIKGNDVHSSYSLDRERMFFLLKTLLMFPMRLYCLKCIAYLKENDEFVTMNDEFCATAL